MLNYNSVIKENKDYNDLTIKEIVPIMKLNIRGKKMFVPMKNKTIGVTITDTIFLDKENMRLNA